MTTALTVSERLEVLSRAARLLAAARDFEDTLAQTIAAFLPALGDFGFFDLVVEGTPASGTVRRTARADSDPELEASLAATRWARQDHAEPNLCGLSSGLPALHRGIDDAWVREAAGPGYLPRPLGVRSMLTVPMRYRDELIGAVTVFFGRSGRQHVDGHRLVAEELAALAVPVVVHALLVERHRRAEHELRLSEERLRLATDAGQLGIWDWNIVEDRVTWSDRVYDLHGLPRGQFGGTVGSFVALVHPEDRARVQATIARALAEGSTYEIEFRTIPPDGRVRCLVARADVLRDASGAPVRMLGASYDVTERVALLAAERAARAEAEVARIEAEHARREAETANRAKDEFLAMLGHELRNPLTPIVAALALLAERDDPATRRERETIARQVAHMSRLVDDLLDVSRIVRGKVELTPEPLDIVHVVAKAIEMTSPLFEQRGVALHGELLSCWASADPVRVAQIASNLLTNAAKFTPAGGRVDVEVRPHGELCELVVRDTGQGISPGLLPHVFGLFVQGPQPLDRQQGGLGLGLAIVANLVELQGGTVTAESDGPGRGSTFRVRLPRIDPPAQAPAPRAPARTAPMRASGRILLVDDNTDAAELIAELLRSRGYEVSVEPSAADALRTAATLQPDLAILDIGLPGMDGYELARKLREAGGDASLRLVALTGYGLGADREQAKAAGFDQHLTKPIAPELLFATVEQLLRS